MNGNVYDFALKPLEVLGLKDLRTELLSEAKGKILEIGIGTGLNIPHYPVDSNVTGIEFDKKMLHRAQSRAMKSHINLIEADAQHLPFQNDEFDTAVATLVFCSIPNPEEALQEVYRVLKPGGKFLLLEHIRKNAPITGRFLDLLTPAWSCFAGGCHLNRDPSDQITKIGFQVESSRIIWNGLGKIWNLKK